MGFIPVPALLDFFSHLFHTVLNYRWEAATMDQKYIDDSGKNTSKTRQKE